jgi:hypothetical protein
MKNRYLIWMILFSYIFGSFLGIVVHPVRAAGSTYYVNPVSGSDSYSGSLSQPFKTIQKALNITVISDDIVLRGGTYTNFMSQKTGLKIYDDGTNSDWFEIRAYPGETPILDCTGFVWSTSNRGIFQFGEVNDHAEYVRLSGITIQDVPSYPGSSSCSAIWLFGYYSNTYAGPHNIQIDNCSFININESVIKVVTEATSDSLRSHDINIADCIFTDTCLDSGVYMGEAVTFYNSYNIVFSNNVFTDCRKCNLIFSGACEDINCYGNSFTDNDDYERHAVYLTGAQGRILHDVNVYNNYIYGHYKGAFDVALESGYTGYIEDCYFYNNVLSMIDTDTGPDCYAIWFDHATAQTGVVFDNIVFKYNTIYQSTKGWVIYFDTLKKNEATNLIFANNVFTCVGTSKIGMIATASSGLNKTDSTIVFRNNVYKNFSGSIYCKWQSGSGVESSAISDDPDFVNRFTNNFDINSTSPCISAANTTFTVLYDFDYVVRPQSIFYDCGAYESLSNVDPIVSGIPDQVITQDNEFTTINLDNYVYDPDNADSSMIWSTEGNIYVTVSIVDRVATISKPFSSWYGYDEVTFNCSDPLGNWDTDKARFSVSLIEVYPDEAMGDKVTVYNDPQGAHWDPVINTIAGLVPQLVIIITILFIVLFIYVRVF